ncbi:D-sedoheptulose-7-phosphate isomerase [Pedococcus sp. 5OH_020]|uniref:D-sedoheptulose-7-phosphate isomerase n=1 Tax=Pedococcus sp. 5OH_020 TaxID=2989814 RepID=UPI003FA774AD
MQSLLAQHALVRQWGEQLATCLVGGAKLLAAGNGGSAAEAQHLTAELVGRFCGERRPLSALSLCAETSSLTAILNDYGAEEIFARQVEAHGRPGDILVLLSTSGTSGNVVHAAKRGHELGLQVWALTGPAPNPLAALADEALTITAGSTAAVQEVHLAAVHAICAAMDATLQARGELLSPSAREASA